MTIFEAIILGIIQGLTEFIPISSSGHIILMQQVFDGASDHLFVEWVNIGTVMALIIYFWPRITSTYKDIVEKKEWRLVRNILLAGIPAGLIGLTFADVIESNGFFGSPWTVAIMLLVVGLVMIFLEKIPRLSEKKDGADLPIKRALAIGAAQAVALIPGTSRSGSTIIAGRLSGLSPAAAAEFSFLLSIPIMLGVVLKLLTQPDDIAYLQENFLAVFLGNFFAFVSGLLAVGFLMRYLKKHSLAVFGWYRIVLSVIIIAILLF
jgi:undecaprenyl-diphosphatase